MNTNIKDEQNTYKQINSSLEDKSVHYDIDKFIEQLYERKLLKEEELNFVIEKSKDIFLKDTNLIEIPCPITICGDIQGQFFDLIQLFKLGGKVPNTNYLFLGNYVSYGYYSIETISLLLCLKIRYPNRIYLLRGKNESREHSQIYGFYEECSRKYENIKIWNNFIELFKFLPLTALVEGKIFCLNGGLSLSIKTLVEIILIDRFQDIPCEGPLFDLIWNSPYIGEGFYKPKGIGYYLFGEDISKKFCRVNNLDMICKGGDCVLNGYSWLHNNKVCVIFSAPNYRYRINNDGAIMEVDENMNLNFYKFDSSPRRGEMNVMIKISNTFQ